MRFKLFLEQETKPVVTTVTKDEVLAWVKQHASNYVKNSLSLDNYIARGVPSAAQYTIGDSSKFKRKAAHTQNFINLFLETSPRWEKYPSRSSAYICSNGLYGAESYARGDDPYLVIPADDAHVGLCPEQDFWISFQKGLTYANLDFSGVEGLNDILTLIGEQLHIKFSESDPVELHNQLRTVKVANLMKLRHSNWKLQLVQAMNHLEATNLNDLLEIVLGPELNKFQQFKATGTRLHSDEDAFETWVEGKCAFIKVNGESLEDTIEGLKDAV